MRDREKNKKARVQFQFVLTRNACCCCGETSVYLLDTSTSASYGGIQRASSANMTTIIMISHNSSVIINHSGEEECAAAGDEEEEDKRSVTDSVTKYDRHNTSIVTFPISSSASQSSSTTSTPDASFITPRPLKSASHGDNVTNGHRAGKSPHRRRLKNSLSTLESDSEDMNITTEGSSGTGSAASTLSSAAYILSSVTYFPSLPEENVGRVTVGSDAMTNMDHSFSCAVTSTPAHSNNNNNHNNNINNVRDQINKKTFLP